MGSGRPKGYKKCVDFKRQHPGRMQICIYLETDRRGLPKGCSLKHWRKGTYLKHAA